ncbi:MAG: hypothetical protein KGH63_03550, partial [Candidatus Micrarchaeota archaeon]|nr:hypothetical protein [Candidatus Micrarchaeota archaeon]
MASTRIVGAPTSQTAGNPRPGEAAAAGAKSIAAGGARAAGAAEPGVGALGPGPAAGKAGSAPAPRLINDRPGRYSADDIKSTKSTSVKDGAFWAVMVGTGESSMSAFALALGAPGGMVGFIQTFPQFFGSLVQLLS